MAGELLTVTQPTEQTPPANYKFKGKLTDRDRGLALQYAKDGLTQAEIGKRLGVTQSAISQWLSACADTTEIAGLYLRGKALSMAENVVKRGQARDHIQALKGIGVLEQDHTQLNIAVGVSLPGLSTVSVAATDTHSLSPRD